MTRKRPPANHPSHCLSFSLKPAGPTPTNSPVRTPSREVTSPRSSATAHSRANPLTYLLRFSTFLPSSGASLHLAISTTCWSRDRFDPFVIAPQQEMCRGRGTVLAVPGGGRHVSGAPGGEAGGLR